jgi:hypothetical protein
MDSSDGTTLSGWVSDNATVSAGSTWTNIASSDGYARVEYSTPHVSGEITSSKNSKNEITARLYFKYVKKNLSIVEGGRLKQRLKRLEKLADDFEKIGQVAMSEECIKQFIILSRESAMWACGYKLFITKEQAEKFGGCIKGEKLKITPLKNYARILPSHIVKKVKSCAKKRLFDEYVIFHLDNKAVKETLKEKEEREKDPIIFGTINETDNYYFIGDWEDELDNLRLTDIIKTLSLKHDKIKIKQHIDMEKVKKNIK